MYDRSYAWAYPDFPSDFTTATVDVAGLLHIVEWLQSAVLGYEKWAGEHGFDSLITAENLLNAAHDERRGLTSWLEEHRDWMNAAERADPAVCSVVEILSEVSTRIYNSVPNDPSIPSGDRCGFLRLSPDMDVFRFGDLTISQLALVRESVASWGEQLPPPKALAGASDSTPKPAPKGPSQDDFRAYWAEKAGLTQTAIAERFTQSGTPTSQGQVSKMLKRVKAWADAGNTIPEITTPEPIPEKPLAMDPSVLDMGGRVDHRAEHQRAKRAEIEGDGWN